MSEEIVTTTLPYRFSVPIILEGDERANMKEILEALRGENYANYRRRNHAPAK